MITATPRQLESMIRISEALARMRLSAVVQTRDVDEAYRLMKARLSTTRYSTNTSWTSPWRQHAVDHCSWSPFLGLLPA